MEEKTQINELAEILRESENIVFFGGAGVSTESGIPDFRSVDGIYNQKYDFPPEVILSHSFFVSYPDEFYKFYRDKLIIKDAKPNKAHLRLAELEQEGKLKSVITQNIDGLHQMAGSNKVLELHGSLLRNYCMRCGKKYPVTAVTGSKNTPQCDCGGVIRPDVVLYEEGLDIDVMNESISLIRKADVLIVGGTSLSVYPAAGLVNYYKGHKLVLINKTPTPMDSIANLLIQDKIGSVFAQI